MRRRAVEREPVAYILGRKGFRHIELARRSRACSSRGRRPSCSSRRRWRWRRRARVVDVGTGSGAVALALKHERPDLEVVAHATSARTRSRSRAPTRERLGLDVRFVHGDLLDGSGEPVDAVVSQPALRRATGARAGARDRPPRAARGAARGRGRARRHPPAGRAGRRAARAAFVALEVGAGQAAEVAELMRAAGLRRVEAARDLAGIERVVVGTA